MNTAKLNPAWCWIFNTCLFAAKMFSDLMYFFGGGVVVGDGGYGNSKWEDINASDRFNAVMNVEYAPVSACVYMCVSVYVCVCEYVYV